MKLLILPTAQEDITSLYQFIEGDSEQAADAMLEAILDTIERLPQFPLMGRVSSRDAETRELVVAPFLVIYTVDTDAVRILQVIHGARFLVR